MQIENFANDVADYAVRNGMPTATEADFLAAVDAYVSQSLETTNKLMTAGKRSPVIKPFFHLSMARAHLA